MSDRFYIQQLNTTGECPGFKGKRRRKLAWTDEKREQVVEMYNDANPTAENSMEIVKEIAEELSESPNGVRMVLSAAGAYIKKAQATKTAGGANGGGRVSKAAAQDSLRKAITDAGQEPDDSIIEKLTGKAAVYLTGVIEAIST